MKLNQKGFGAIEGLLVIIALALIVGAGFYVFSANKDTKTDNSSQKSEAASSTKSTPASNTQKAELQSDGKTLATLEIPKDWETTVAHKSRTFGDGPACSQTATNNLTSLDYGSTTFPGANATSYGASYGVIGFDIVKQPNSKALEQYFTDDLYGGTDAGTHSFEKLTINGNPAVVYNGSANDDNGDVEYKLQYYLVSHKGYVACVNWRHYNQNSSAPAANYDYSKHLPDVEAIAKSIKFAN